MKTIKICVIGNSVALRVRPNVTYPDNKNYTEIISKELNEYYNNIVFLTDNRAKGASTILNIFDNFDNLVNAFPDYYIINIGVVDASSREVPLWFYRLATRNNDNFCTYLIKLLYRNLIAKIRPLLTNIRFNKPWVTEKTFTSKFEELVSRLIKETNSKIIVLPINIANDRIENQLPGSKNRQKRYNQIMKNITKKYKQSWIDLSDSNPEKHYPDGVHFSVYGHQMVAKHIEEIILKNIYY